MKKLIYSQEDVDLMISIETQQYQEELEYQKEENKKQKEVLDKIKEYVKKLEEDYPDYDGEIVIGDISDKAKKDILKLLEEIE